MVCRSQVGKMVLTYVQHAANITKGMFIISLPTGDNPASNAATVMEWTVRLKWLLRIMT